MERRITGPPVVALAAAVWTAAVLALYLWQFRDLARPLAALLAG